MAFLTVSAFRLLIRLLACLSLDAQRRLARGLGWLATVLDTDAARVSRINLQLCLPELDEAARRRIARASLAHSAMLLTEMGTVYGCPVEHWRRLAVRVEGESLLQSAARSGSGVLVLVPHLGNWEFLSLILGQYGVTALYDPPRQRALEPLIREARNRGGARMLPIDPRGLRGFYQALAGGGVTALLPDQVPDRRAGVYAEFFGRPALTMTFAHRLIQRTGARVVLGTALRRPGGFQIRFVAMDDALCDPDPVVATRAMNTAIEQLVRADPEQYQWEYKRFKRPPPDTPDPYARR